MSGPRIIFIHGPPACGKNTIGNELSAATGLPLYHNHLVVDLLLSLFEFGSPPFVRHRERIWLDMMGDAVGAGSSFIFTFNPERTVSPDFPRVLSDRVETAGGKVTFVEIVCSEEEIEKRVKAQSRKKFRKLSSLKLYRELKRDGVFDYPRIESELRIDSSSMAPRESASRIIEVLGLKKVQAR